MDTITLIVVIAGAILFAFGIGFVIWGEASPKGRETKEWVVGWASFLLAFGLATLLYYLFDSNAATTDLLGVKLGGPVAAGVGVGYIMLSVLRGRVDSSDYERQLRELQERSEQEQTNLLDELNAKAEEINELRAHIRHSEAVPPPPPTLRLESETIARAWEIPDSDGKRIVLSTGNIIEIEDVDVLVNSENDYMQMARTFDRTVSGSLRYAGAYLGVDGHIREDTLADELADLLSSQDVHFPVLPATVYVTSAGHPAGRLRHSGARYVFHVVSVRGVPGTGYQALPDDLLKQCVQHCLERVDGGYWRPPLTSILFPLLGAGHGDRAVKGIAQCLVSPAVQYLRRHRAATTLERVHFLVYSSRSREIFEPELEEIMQAIGAKEL